MRAAYLGATRDLGRHPRVSLLLATRCLIPYELPGSVAGPGHSQQAPAALRVQYTTSSNARRCLLQGPAAPYEPRYLLLMKQDIWQ